MSIMDPLVNDKDIQKYLYRDWDGGLDNEGLDITQLDNFINDANNDTMYFGELSGVEDLKCLGGMTPKDSPSRQHNYNHHSNQHLHHNNQHQHGHHLPDSPPDSGSEPPFSPDHPNLSPNQRGNLTELYNSTQNGGTTLLNIGGFNHIPSQSNQNAHIHPPQPSIHPQAPIQNTLQHNSGNISGAVSFSPHQVGLPNSQTLTVSMPSISPYGQMITANGQRSDVVTNGGKKRKASEMGTQQQPSTGVNIKQEPEQNPNSTSSSALSNHKHNHPVTNTGSSLPGPGGGGGGGGGGGPANAAPVHSGSISYNGEEEEFSMDTPSNGFLDPSLQCIRFQAFQQQTWSIICDSSLKELSLLTFRVDADKGFNFSHPDDAFVCQKKNHFQVTTHIQISGEPYYVKTPEGLLQKVNKFHVHFYGVKTESPAQTIRVEQSQSDRSKKAFHPVPIDLKPDQVTKVTVGRLHFSETTSNNMRKKGKPNPDQRYFYLVVSLQAHCGDSSYPIAAHASEKIIVRASNPGQFESDVEYTFQRGTYPESIFHMGKVGINTDRPDEALVIHGNLKITGQLYQPSDLRAKEHIQEVDTKEQLRNVQSLRMVKYAYKENFAKQAGFDRREIYDTGVIAQEVKRVIPDAVRETGNITLYNGEKIENFLMVNKERIFMENVGAVKELCKVTGNLENRIGELERMNNKLKRIDSIKSTNSSSTRTSSLASNVSSMGHRKNGCRRGSRHRQISRNNPELCTNRLLQISTIAVISIMAFCLMAMATIYILDYQGRLRNSSTHYATTTNGLNYTIITGSRTPATFFPFNLSSSVNTDIDSSISFFPTSFKTFHPSSPPTTSSSVDENTLTSFVFRITTTPPLVPDSKPPVLGAPEGCSSRPGGSNLNCQVYCCSASSRRVPLIRYTSRTPSITVTRRFRVDGRTSPTPMQNNYEDDLITNKVPTSDPYNVYNMSTTETQQILGFKPQPRKKSSNDYLRVLHFMQQRNRSRLSSPTRKYKRIISKRTLTDAQIKSHMSIVENRMPVIEIRELNAAVSHIYCLNASREQLDECSNGTANNFTYGLPLSPYMPHDDLTMLFSFQNPEEAHKFTICNNCSDCSVLSAYEEECNNDEATPLHLDRSSQGNVTNSTYRVTLFGVGKRQRIAYKFRRRIENGDHVDPCVFEESSLGEKFYEYNFIFYRVCSR